MIIIDKETGILIGDPYKLPFESPETIDLLKLQENVEKRMKYGLASVSGIRQIFDQTFGDEQTDFVDGTSTEITTAAKIHVATIADCFSELIIKKTSKKKPIIVVGIDSRHTSPAIADVAIRILIKNGIEVRYTFITPITETALYSSRVSDGFIYISASHNPRGYNGLKMGFDDGRLLPGDTAKSFIDIYKSRIYDIDNTSAMIYKANDVKPEDVLNVYNKIDTYRKESRKIYSSFADSIITGLKDKSEIEDRKNTLRDKVIKRNICIGIDLNGGARSDKEYLESWGFDVAVINGRPREDMVHDLSPIPSACSQAKSVLIDLQNKGKNIIAFLVFDTDGDRKNIVISDGKGGAVIPGVQMIFVLDVLCSILNAKISLQNQNIGVVINDATSSILEHLSHYLDFTVKRVEVGEANVASAGINLSNQGLYIPIMGEGSNGSVFNLDLLVREPLHTIRTIIDFITKPELTQNLLKSLRYPKEEISDMINHWYSPENINGLFMNIIKCLPPSRTTDFFTDEGIHKCNHDLRQEGFKKNFDEYFESYLWHNISQEIKRTYGGEPVAEFVNNEGQNELRGRGNRITNTGGYKVEFYTVMPDNNKRHIGWIWFRISATETGIMRKGVSISHWEISPKASGIVNQIYDYIYENFTNALKVVEEITLKN
ncbi:MAG: hypothetical protein ACUVWN_00480 [bacterium]